MRQRYLVTPELTNRCRSCVKGHRWRRVDSPRGVAGQQRKRKKANAARAGRVVEGAAVELNFSGNVRQDLAGRSKPCHEGHSGLAPLYLGSHLSCWKQRAESKDSRPGLTVEAARHRRLGSAATAVLPYAPEASVRACPQI